MYFYMCCKLQRILYFINVLFERPVNFILLLEFLFSLYLIILNRKTLAL